MNYKHKTHTLRLLMEQLAKSDVRRTNGSNSPRQERSTSGLAENGGIQHVNMPHVTYCACAVGEMEAVIAKLSSLDALFEVGYKLAKLS